jgi:hypothetical protein
MNELTLLREAGPEASALTPAARSAARAALLAEIGAGRSPRRLRLPARRTSLRLGVGLVAIAAAWATAVTVAGPDAAAPRPGSVALVDFALPAFPLTLPEAPPGTTGPTFGGMGSGGGTMHYLGTDEPVDSLHVSVFPEEPADPSSGASDVVLEDEVDVDGRTARLVVVRAEGSDVRMAHLDLERSPGQFVSVSGQGRFADGDLLVDTAEALVDVPQAVPLQLRLAPAGFTLDFFKEDGRIVRLADESDPERMRGLSVHLPLPGEELTADQLPGMVEGAAGPVEQVTVHGRPAALVPVEHGEVDRGWFLQARFPDGTTFVVQAPETLTREQVVRIAEQVTYTP